MQYLWCIKDYNCDNMVAYKVMKSRKKTNVPNPFQTLEMIETTWEEDLPFGLRLQYQWGVDSSLKVYDFLLAISTTI